MKRPRQPSRDRKGAVPAPAASSPTKAPPDRRVWWVSAALFLINLIVFYPVRTFGFVTWDDPQYITQNPFIVNGLTGESIRWALTTGYQFYWHPLTWLSYLLDVSLHGLEPGGFHITNLILHTTSTVLLFFVLRSMTGAFWRSAFAASIFAVHPLRVESVAWIAERKDVLSTFFWILTMWAYLAYVRKPNTKTYLAVFASFAAGLMSKPMLVTMPFALLLLDYWPLQRLADRKRVILEKLPLLTLAIVSSIVTFLTQTEAGAVGGLSNLPISERITNAIVSVASYLGMTIWPVNLAPLYPFHHLPAWKIASCAILLLAITAAVLKLARGYPYLITGWFWYLGTLLPVIGLVQVGNQALADRFMYIPMIGSLIIAAWGIADLIPQQRTALAIGATAAIAACIAASTIQLQYWKDSITMWRRVLAVTTENWQAHTNLGYDLYGQGNVPEAIAQFQAALAIRPDFPEAHNDLGAALMQQGKLDEAIPHYQRALELKPTLSDAHTNLGVAFANTGRTDDAIREFQESLRLNPNHADTHSNLAVMYEGKGQINEATQHFREALRLNPQHAEARRSLDRLMR